MEVPEKETGCREQEGDSNHNDYVLNCIHKNRPLTLNDVARPVFVNHYYAGQAFIPATRKKLIKLDECDVSTENSLRNVQQQGAQCEYREHSQKSPQNQIRETKAPMPAQLPHQRSCQDVRMDPRYQKPPHYAEIHHHRPVPQMLVEINEVGPAIQQGVIQRPVQRDTQATRSRRSTPSVNTQQTTSVPNLQITGNGGTRERDKLPKQEGDPNPNDYIFNCIHKNRPLTLNDVARPVFVNHYYVGEAFIPATSKKLIKLDECDVSTENSLRSIQQQNILKIHGWHSSKPE